MAAVGGANVYAVQIQLEQLFIIGKYLRILGAVLGLGLFGALNNQIAEGDQLGLAQRLDGGHMLAVGDTAAADDTSFQLISHDNFLLSFFANNLWE